MPWSTCLRALPLAQQPLAAPVSATMRLPYIVDAASAEAVMQDDEGVLDLVLGVDREAREIRCLNLLALERDLLLEVELLQVEAGVGRLKGALFRPPYVASGGSKNVSDSTGLPSRPISVWLERPKLCSCSHRP